MTQEQLTAKQFDVPFPQTCEVLLWKGITNFYWVQSFSGKYYLCVKDSNLEYHEVENPKSEILGFVRDFPAPQIREILSHFPEKIYYENRKFWYQLIIKSAMQQMLYGYKNDFDPELLISFADWHLSEAAAGLYLKLKEKNLLKTN